MDDSWGDKAFGARLKTLARQRKRALASLAIYAGMSPGYVYRLARGLQSPSWAAACALADELGVSVEEFRDRPAVSVCQDCQRLTLGSGEA